MQHTKHRKMNIHKKSMFTCLFHCWNCILNVWKYHRLVFLFLALEVVLVVASCYNSSYNIRKPVDLYDVMFHSIVFADSRCIVVDHNQQDSQQLRLVADSNWKHWQFSFHVYARALDHFYWTFYCSNLHRMHNDLTCVDLFHLHNNHLKRNK